MTQPCRITIPQLETERLIMRGFIESDIPHVAAFYGSERSQFVGGPIDADQAWRGVAGIIGHWHLRGFGFWALEDKETGAFLGHTGLWYPDGWPEPEIGWSLLEAAEGRGIAHEAAIEARRYAYEVLGWTTAISLIDPQNARSIALAERLGARFDYEFDHKRYGRTLIYRHLGPEALGLAEQQGAKQGANLGGKLLGGKLGGT